MADNALTRSLTMGALCAVVGMLTGLVIVQMATGDGYEAFLIGAPLAAFVTGSLLWWLFRVRPRRYGPLGGAITGAAAGAIAHYVCWYGFILWSAACYAATGGCTDSLGSAPMDPIFGIAGATLYALISLIAFGWFTVPAGAAIGGVLAYVQGRSGSVPLSLSQE